MAEFFPLFGQHSIYNPEALAFIIEKYELNKKIIKDLDICVRTNNCLKNANIKTLDEVLMIYPYQLNQIKNWSQKSTGDIQNAAEQNLGVEIM